MCNAKPILFNTEMVRALLANRKSVTRRVVKPHYRDGEAGFRVITNKHTGQYVRIEIFDEWEDETRWMNEPYRPGDILYVRETWCRQPSEKYPFVYRASVKTPDAWKGQWRPSIHMPREAARLFLRVTDVRVERLQEIDDAGVAAEGLEIGAPFDELWDSTIKKADLDRYGWDANPYVWCVSFERISKEEAEKNA